MIAQLPLNLPRQAGGEEIGSGSGSPSRDSKGMNVTASILGVCQGVADPVAHRLQPNRENPPRRIRHRRVLVDVRNPFCHLDSPPCRAIL
jgi:hypothetical protein